MPEPFPSFDLPGKVTVTLSDPGFTPDALVAVVEQELVGPVKYAAWVPMSREVVADQAMFRAALDRGIDRWLRPWRYPDRNPIPRLVPLPLLEAAMQVPVRARAVRRRLHDAWLVLTGRESIWEDDDA